MGLCGHDKHARIADTLSTTIWDVWQEHMRKGDRSIDAPATSFTIQPTAKVLFAGSYIDKSMRDQHQNQVKWGLHTNFK